MCMHAWHVEHPESTTTRTTAAAAVKWQHHHQQQRQPQQSQRQSVAGLNAVLLHQITGVQAAAAATIPVH
eukprot:359170-Chlamydomonas_euryale.AAC.7